MKKFFILFLLLLPLQSFAYPGCGSDIIVGGQVWASCNSTSKGKGSTTRSGWFFFGEKFPIFSSSNGYGRLSAETRNRAKDATVGPCAKGYRLPTRGEWETAIWYARLNQTTLSRLLALPQNGGYDVYRDSEEVTPVERENTLGSYWSSTVEDIYGEQPIVLHIGSTVWGRGLESTEPAGEQIDLLTAGILQIANVRCIRK